MAACAEPAPPSSAVSPLLDPDGRFFEAPFPTAARERDDRTLDVSDFPTRGNALAATYVDALVRLAEGYSRNAGFWFPLSGELDPVSLPAAPDAARSFDSVEVPLYQRGAKPYLEDGDIAYDALGAPLEQGTESIRVALAVPRQPMPAAGYPLLFHVPGSGGSYLAIIDRGGVQGAGLASVLAPRGLGALGVEANHTGPRHPSGDTTGFHFYDVFNPISWRDNHRQQAAEFEVLARLARELRLPGALVPEANAAELRFDPGAFLLHGHSTGSVVGASILAQSDSFRAGVLTGAGGSWLYNLVLKQSPPSAELARRFLTYRDDDEVDELDPVLQLAATLWDPVEPMNQAPLWAKDGAVRTQAASVLLVEGILDTYYVPRMVNALATAAQLDAASPLVDSSLAERLRAVGGDERAPPFSANRTGFDAQRRQRGGHGGRAEERPAGELPLKARRTSPPRPKKGQRGRQARFRRNLATARRDNPKTVKRVRSSHRCQVESEVPPFLSAEPSPRAGSTCPPRRRPTPPAPAAGSTSTASRPPRGSSPSRPMARRSTSRTTPSGGG